MTYSYDPKIRRYLLILMIGFFLTTLCTVLDCCYPFNTAPAAIGRWGHAFISVPALGFSLYLYIVLPKLNPKKVCKFLGIFEIIETPFLLIVLFFCAFLTPRTLLQADFPWVFAIEMVVVIGQFVLGIVFLTKIYKRINGGNHGLLPVFARVLISTILQGALILSYGFAVGRLFVLAGVDPNNPEVIQEILGPFLAVFLSQAFVFLLFVLAFFGVALLTFIAGIENRLLGVKGTFRGTAALCKKYDVIFWMGILVALFLMVLALVSAIQLGFSYYSLVLLYATLIIVRVPSFFWKKRVEKMESDKKVRFEKIHNAIIFAGAVFMIFAVVSFFVGQAGAARKEETQSAFLIYAFFIPWAIFKTVSGVLGQIKARKTGIPFAFIESYADLLMAIVTVNTIIFYIANFLRQGRPIDQNLELHTALIYLIGLMFAFVEIGYVVYVAIRLLVIGIRGKLGKRKKAFALYCLHTPGKSVEILGENYTGHFIATRIACRTLVIQDGKILLSYQKNTDQWMIPGGGVEKNENDIQTASRETMEETGYIVKPTDFTIEINEYYEDFRYISRYFVAEVVGETQPKLTPREEEAGMEPRWISVDEALSIFKQHESYAKTDEMRRGLYLRELTALESLS